MPRHVSSKHLQNTTELTMIMPVKPGLIESMDTMTYGNRLRRLMTALNGLRQASREQSSYKPLSDSVERIETIQSFRLALLDNDTRLLLSVAFDGPWEPYIRKVWHDLGPLLDVIVCNCEDYPLSFESSFRQYAAWIRRYQVEANFFYTAANISAADVYYLKQAERNQRETHDPVPRDQQAAHLYIIDPATRAAKVAAEHPQALLSQGLTALGLLDSLREIYPDNTDDGAILLRAAHEILRELKQFDTRQLPAPVRAPFEPQLLWFEQAEQPRERPPIEAFTLANDDIQGGILTPYPDIRHGALLLFGIHDAENARRFLADLPLTTEADSRTASVYCNLALTLEGLRKLGMAESDIAKFPPEFLQGMEARAGLLGDVRGNHPQKWTLPEQNWPANSANAGREVPLSTVDFIVQLRTGRACAKNGHQIHNNPGHPLYKAIDAMSRGKGVELLCVEAMTRHNRGHFGFADGISQPVVQSKKRPGYWSDIVAPGEIILGYQNDRDFLSAAQSGVDPLLTNGTFMVIRKIQQNVAALQEFLDEQQSALADHGMNTDDLKGLMMGRKPNGKPLVPHKGENDFNFAGDRDGSGCPLQSHIRRTNPRCPALGEPRQKIPIPRLVRRGMSYGPASGDASDGRGLLFIAYNASIANQFEVIQSWAAGANKSHTYSELADPFLGVPRQGEKRTFRCLSPRGDVLRFDMDKSDTEKRPFTQLQWGTYLFVPSLSALQLIVSPRALQPQSPLQTGEQWIAKLQAVEQAQGAEAAAVAWKTVLEEAEAAASGLTAAIWNAIRDRHGALRTPYGILVGREDLVNEVLRDDKTFSVCGYAGRMHKSLGDIYLGLDSGKHYNEAATFTNAVIGKVTEKEGFDLARQYAQQKLQYLRQFSGGHGPVTISLPWLVDQVLADLSRYWFDLPDGEFIKAGGKPAPNQTTLHCPYHFTPPSRYIFSPNPGDYAAFLGEDSGSRLREAAIGFVRSARGKKNAIKGSISKPLFKALKNDEQLAQNLIGAMMGFLPTAMGLFLKTLYQWMEDDQLAGLQQDFHRLIKTSGYTNSKKLLMPQLMTAMQKAPVPFMIWRTTTRPCTLGGIDLHREQRGKAVPDRVVIGISSLTQGKLQKGELDVCPIFGGDRWAGQHPTHACPGKDLAMGVLLGMITALLEGATLRDSGVPLVLAIQ